MTRGEGDYSRWGLLALPMTRGTSSCKKEGGGSKDGDGHICHHRNTKPRKSKTDSHSFLMEIKPSPEGKQSGEI